MTPSMQRYAPRFLVAAVLLAAASFTLWRFFPSAFTSSSAGWRTHRGGPDNMGLLRGNAPAALDRLVWETKGDAAFWAGPSAADGALYAGDQFGHVYSFELKDGHPRWKTKLDSADFVHAPPELDVSRGLLYLGSSAGFVHALDMKTGERRWSFSAAAAVNGAPRLWKDRLYAATMGGSIHAVNPSTGESEWAFAVPEGQAVYATPAIRDGVLYFATMTYEQPAAMLGALDLASRSLKWSLPLFGYVKASPAVDEATVYAATGGNYLYAADIKTGGELWRFKAEYSLNADPAVDDSRVYAGSRDGHVYAVDKKTGEKVWHFAAPGWFENGLLVSSRFVYAGNSEGALLVLNKADGSEQARFTAKGAIYASPALWNGIFYFGDTDGWLYAVADSK